MALPATQNFPEAFRSPHLDPDLSAALDDVYFMDENGKYTLVPLVWEEREDIALEGPWRAESALLLCAGPEGDVSLKSVSTDGANTEQLARVSYDLLEPIHSAMLMDIGGVGVGAINGGYLALGGVLTHSRTDIEATFPLLVVPMYYRFAGYDSLNLHAEENARYRNMSRADVSRAMATAVMEFGIEHSVVL